MGTTTKKQRKLQWHVEKDAATAMGARHHYRVFKTGRTWYAQQRTSSWTDIAGRCGSLEEAQELAQRYENGERQLSHKQWRGVAYQKLPAQVA